MRVYSIIERSRLWSVSRFLTVKREGKSSLAIEAPRAAIDGNSLTCRFLPASLLVTEAGLPI